MTNSLASYTGLITSEHNQKPKFVATVSLSCQPFVDQQALLSTMLTNFDLDTAAGVQLDTIGLWVGLSRQIDIPLINLYFSLDSAPLGLDSGYLKGPFDPAQGVVSLSDDTYRFALYAQIAANNWDGTTQGVAASIALLFTSTLSPGTLFFIQDNQDMTITFALAGVSAPPILAALLSKVLIPLKPAGIAALYLQTSVSGTPIFGLDVNNAQVSGLDVGAIAIPV